MLKGKFDYYLMRLPDVLSVTGLGKSSLYKKIKEGTFPSPVSLGARAVAFKSNEVEEWIENRPRAVREE